MRSQIACSHCRRSKVKCVNSGTDSVCKACQNQNRECTYPEAGSSGPRRESIADRTGDAPRAKRQKKTAAPSSQGPYLIKKLGSPANLTDSAFDPHILTPQIWNELFDIFQQHYATDLPFLHAPTFRNEVQKLPSPLLLAFLALTSRFHPYLVERHGNNAIQAAEYYAEAARLQLDGYGLPSEVNINTIQALLMLGLHEWGMARGAKAYRIIGSAIDCAGILGLQVEPDLDLNPEACATAQNPTVTRNLDRSEMYSKEQEVIEKEIKRRTFWSCFIMDRYLSFGKYRIQKLDIAKIRVQLPCSDHAFIFGHEVNTAILGEDEEAARQRFKEQREQKWAREKRAEENGNNMNSTYDYHMSDSGDRPKEEIGTNEGLLSRYIRAMELYGQVIQWACTGGRRQRQDINKAPWNPETTFWKLEQGLKGLTRALPGDLTLTPRNTLAHIENNTSRHYTLMHSVHLLCSIALYREYMAFLPFDLDKPVGPVDEPTLPPEKFPLEDPLYWENQARDCFKAARSLIDLLHACQMKNVLVETPLSGYATWQAVTCGIYAYFFPKMDVDSSLSTKSQLQNGHSVAIDFTGHEAFLRSTAILKHMSKALKIAVGWGQTDVRLRDKIWNTTKLWKKDRSALVGRGLTEYLEMEKALKEFGDNSKDKDDNEDVNMPDFTLPKDEDVSDSSSAPLKRESWDPVEGKMQADGTSESTPKGQWVTVNSSNKVEAQNKVETQNNASAVSSSVQYHFGSQMVGHTTQGIMAPAPAPAPKAYHQYGPILANQHQTTHYGPLPTESAQRTSLSMVQFVQNPAHARHKTYPSPAFSNEMRYCSFGPSDLVSFSGGYDENDWRTQTLCQGWMSELWHSDDVLTFS